MSISSEITRISNAKTAIAQSIANKGVTVPSGTKIDGMAALIDSIQTGGGGGDTSETWVLNEYVDTSTKQTFACSFESNGRTFSKLVIGGRKVPGSAGLVYSLLFDDTKVADGGAFLQNSIYRKVTFATAPTGGLLTWLQSNAVKQASDTAVQPSKALTVTSNGTTTITPDVPYDAIKQVDLTVNAKSVSTVTINCEADDSFAFWLSPNGVFHDIRLKAGANTITVVQYSPIGVYNAYGYTLNNLNNIVNSGSVMEVIISSNGTMRDYHIYYATAITASATQPTD